MYGTSSALRTLQPVPDFAAQMLVKVWGSAGRLQPSRPACASTRNRYERLGRCSDLIRLRGTRSLHVRRPASCLPHSARPPARLPHYLTCRGAGAARSTPHANGLALVLRCPGCRSALAEGRGPILSEQIPPHDNFTDLDPTCHYQPHPASSSPGQACKPPANKNVVPRYSLALPT